MTTVKQRRFGHQSTNRSEPLVLHLFPTFAIGGVQNRFAGIANWFGQRWRHAIVAMDGDLSCRELLNPGLNVVFPQVRLQKGDTLGNVARCRAALRELMPSVFVTSNWGTLEWSFGNWPPLVRHVHLEDGLGPDELHSQHARRVWTRRLVLRRSTVVVPSHGLYDMARGSWWLPQRRLRLIPNGVDLNRFNVRARRPAGPLVIGAVARLRAEKNIGLLLHAFRTLRLATPARLVIVGDGPERPELEQLAGELCIGTDVHFVGHMPRPEAAFRDLDIFALSSNSEAMPMSVLEAMASGLPVVATDVGDVRRMLAPQNGAFVVARDARALAEALLGLAASPKLRYEIGAANSAQAERDYDQEIMFAAWAAVFDGTIP